MAKKNSKRSRAPRRKSYWEIKGYRGLQQTFCKTISSDHFTEGSIQRCLQSLVAAALDPEEIIAAHARRGTKSANTLLDVHRDAPNNTYLCGTDPHFSARQIAAS